MWQQIFCKHKLQNSNTIISKKTVAKLWYDMHCQNNILDCYQLGTKYIYPLNLGSNLKLAKYCFFVCCYFLCTYLTCIELKNGLKYEKKWNVVFTKKNCNYVLFLFFCRHLMTIVYWLKNYTINPAKHWITF